MSPPNEDDQVTRAMHDIVHASRVLDNAMRELCSVPHRAAARAYRRLVETSNTLNEVRRELDANYERSKSNA